MENRNVYGKGRNVFGLAGRLLNSDIVDRAPLKQGHNYTREDIWKLEFEELYRNAETKEDLNALGAKLNYAIDNKLDINVIDYQFMGAKKMTEIYKKEGCEVKI